MTWAIFPREAHYQAVAEILATGSPRVVAVVGVALLDEAVTRTLRERFRNDGNILNNLLNVDKPLGNLGPKIDILYLMEAFDEKVRGTLKGLATVRNFFAHHLDASFDSSDDKFLKSMRRLVLHENKTHYPHHLHGGDGPHPIEPLIDKKTTFLVNLKLGLIMLMRDRVSHIIHSNTPRTEEQIKQLYTPTARSTGQTT